MKTYILKYNISNLVNLIIRYLDFETLHCFGYASNKAIHHILDNVENVKKIHFLTQKCVYYDCILRKVYQHSFSKNSVHFSEPLGLVYSDLLKLPILSYLRKSTSEWLYFLITIFLIIILLFCTKSLKLQKQLSQFSGCDQILLPIL